VPTTDISIITGKNMNIGLRIAPEPEVKYSAIIPTVATTMATGSRRASGLPGTALGMSGGPSTAISPSATGGAGRRGSRMNSIGQWTLKPAVWFHSQVARLLHIHRR
jgi:hypothetical protein